MPYRVDTFDVLLTHGPNDDRDAADPVRLENALNAAEKDGWTLVNILPQYRTWNDEGESTGLHESLFVFHKPEQTQTRIVN